jgi:cytochrome c oxidase subunit III
MFDSARPEFIETAGGSRGPGPNVPQRTYVTGIIIALGGIAMFFIALVSAFIVRKGFPNNDWQPLEIPRILWLNTLILLASSATLARSRKNFLAYREDAFRHWWGVTAILGLFFLAGQVIAWRQLAAAGVFLATNPSSSFFYVFTIAHALHLLCGIAALFAVAIRPSRHLARSTATEVVAIYWHSMDGLWLFLFLLLLLAK